MSRMGAFARLPAAEEGTLSVGPGPWKTLPPA
ncbi:uncharacterized protein SOCE26_100080 [Sorangium cellulosum]|uniref:Uncharacterized protein n=1 Tax=Sorangium cellulosum TaxID=56 RepID=A0A2L0FA74_SORCE|nr:uncharacterized protein SOCE26_100080 [Sorangium cellulosum]